MSTRYEVKVNSLRDAILGALERHTDASSAALDMLAAASPSSVSRDPSNPAAAASILQPPAAAQATLLGHAFTVTVLHLSRSAVAAGLFLMDLRLGPSETPSAALLVDSALWLASQTPPALDAGLPAVCLEIAIEASTNAECEGVIAYLDSRLAQFKRPNVYKLCYRTLLRACNLLLSRLSMSEDASLRGAVLLFLAKLLPLTERSGVNLTGTFHKDNVTPLDDVEEGALDAEGRPVDVKFYKTFWGLQRWFSDPPAVLEPGRWREVSKDIRTVLARFAKAKVTVTESALGSAGSSDGASGTAVKYLSSARLLPLQLRDASFRRDFLIQALVLTAWAENPHMRDFENKGVNEADLADLKDLRSQIYAVLEATPEKGRQFAEAVRTVMAGDVEWAAWKRAACPEEPLQVPAAKAPAGLEEQEAGPPRKRADMSSECTYGIQVGTPELDRLWNLTEDNVSTLGADDRGGFKTLRQLMEPVIEEMQEGPDAMGDDFKASSNSTYVWKTLRMMSRDMLSAYASAVKAGGDLTVGARALYPDEVPPEPEPVVDEAAAAEGDGSGKETPAAAVGGEEGDEDMAEAPAEMAAAGVLEAGVGAEEVKVKEEEEDAGPASPPAGEEGEKEEEGNAAEGEKDGDAKGADSGGGDVEEQQPGDEEEDGGGAEPMAVDA